VRRTRPVVGLVGLAGLLLAVAVAPASAQPVPRASGFDYDGFNTALNMYESRHPNDWVGLERVLTTWGATDYRVTVPAIGVRDATAGQAQAAYRRYLALSRPNTVSPTRLSVSGSTALLRTGEYLVQGNWNWDDSFIGMQAPADLASLEYSSHCWKGTRAYWNMHDYVGNNHTGQGFWYSANPSTFTHVLGITDKTSSFVAWNDNGNERYFMQSTGCFTHDIAAAFQYEHNQGGSLLGVSVGFGFLSVSYSTGDDHMQKSTGVFH
jgi:hypothetical protein